MPLHALYIHQSRCLNHPAGFQESIKDHFSIEKPFARLDNYGIANSDHNRFTLAPMDDHRCPDICGRFVTFQPDITMTLLLTRSYSQV